jgi:DNA adenine methylase
VAAKRDVVGAIAAAKVRATRTKLPANGYTSATVPAAKVNATRTLLAATGSTSGTVAAAQAVAKQTTLAANSNPRGTVATVGEIRPPLKWAGGKRWLVPRLRELYAPYRNRRLVEPLCGGLAVALGLQPQRALLNDISPHASNFYRRLKAGFSIALEMRNDERLYYRHRERFNLLVAQGAAESLEAAALFYFLNRTGYNGLCRFNSRGEFNVPFGRYTTINYVRDFACYRAAFARWTFSSKDFAHLPLRPDDFVYADPPYDVVFTRYAKEDFGWEDQVRLADYLAQHRGPVVLSNQATERIVELYERRGFALSFLAAPRRISCKDRKPALEVLATRNL